MWLSLYALAAPDPTLPAEARIEEAQLARAAWVTRLSIPHAPERTCTVDADCGLASLECCMGPVAVRADLVDEASIARWDPRCTVASCAPRQALAVRAACVEHQCTVERARPAPTPPLAPLVLPEDLPGRVAAWQQRLASPAAPERACQAARDCSTARLACCGLPVAVHRDHVEAVHLARHDERCHTRKCAAPPAHHVDCVQGLCEVVVDAIPATSNTP